jgi:potassium-dependent mechanosensitive channel
MSPLLKLLCCTLLLGQLVLVDEASADTDINIKTIQSELSGLADDGLTEGDKSELQGILQNTLTFLQRSQSLTQKQADLRRKIEQAPEYIRAARLQIEKLKIQTPESLHERYASQRLDTLEALLDEKVNRMSGWQNELTKVNSELIAERARPERTQADIITNQSRVKAVTEQLLQLQLQEGSRVNQAHIRMLGAEQQSLVKANDLLRQELTANSVLLDQATQKRDLLKQQIDVIELEEKVLQDVINEKRRTQSEQTVSETTTQTLLVNNHELLRKQGSFNQRLSEELLATTDRVGELTRKNIKTLKQIDSMTQIDSSLEQQISVLEGNVLLSRILQQQKRALPGVRLDTSIADQIADLRLRQFELNALRDDLGNPEAYLLNLMKHLPEDQQKELSDDLRVAIDSRTSLVDELTSNINTLLSQAITLQVNQRQLQQLSSALRRTIDDHLVWVASNRPIDTAWLIAFPSRALKQWKMMDLGSQMRTLFDILAAKWPWMLVLWLLVSLLTWWRRKLRLRLSSINEDVGFFRRDSIAHTPFAIALCTLLILPMPLILAAIGLIISTNVSQAMPALGEALLQLSLAWLVLHLMYRLLDSKGVAIRHFRWQEDLVTRLHRLTHNMAWIMLPVVLVIAVNSSVSEQQSDYVIGRLVIMLGMALLGIQLYRMLRGSQPLYRSKVLHFTAMMVLTLIPLILAVMTFWGYYYTAIKLADRFIDTLYLIFIWMLLEGTIVRNLSVAGRRLAYQWAVNKREAAQGREEQDSEIVVDIPPEMNIKQINQQSLRLARLAMLILFGTLVYLVWSDLLSAASYLESVTLWEYNSGTSSNPVMSPMSAGAVLGALLIVVFTITLARNLPGLLEILVLSRLKLKQGSSYAITTLLSYVIVSIGIIAGLSALGVSWGKLQWLVAALGVGLGFGLQEIFANFVSGLIILFERPVRIGDVVTIGELSGTVNRIHIRATTIVDFDRKEIIVPNKAFVTDQLINWSLSDAITRVVIKVGVSYGSELAKAKELMLQIARNNPRVLKEPEPMVLFLNFGDSTLDHELRVHVGELLDRNMVIDELNREIYRVFAENDIEIAFSQLDINLRNSEGLERLVSSRQVEGKNSQQAKEDPLPKDSGTLSGPTNPDNPTSL